MKFWDFISVILMICFLGDFFFHWFTRDLAKKHGLIQDENGS